MCILVQILKMHLLKLKICKGLNFIHERGIAHLDVKPDNIYVRNGVYKLGDFGCATLIDRSLAIEDGDSRYMPPEMLNDKYENLDKVDIFCLGAAIYELIRGTPLPDSGPHFASIREGRITLLPGCPMQFQSLIKV
jgi:wee1-like protein kinase